VEFISYILEYVDIQFGKGSLESFKTECKEVEGARLKFELGGI